MSHRIVDAHVVIAYPREALVEAIPELKDELYDKEYFLLAELGGDNNSFEEHPQDRSRQVRSRDWSVLAFGDKRGIMRKVVEYSVMCEGGSMRFSKQGDTLPEAYIARVRKMFDAPIPFEEISNYHLSVTATIRDPADSPDLSINKYNQYESRWINKIEPLLNQYSTVSAADAIGRSALYDLHLSNPSHAALLMAYGNELNPDKFGFRMATIYGPCFECEGLGRITQFVSETLSSKRAKSKTEQQELPRVSDIKFKTRWEALQDDVYEKMGESNERRWDKEKIRDTLISLSTNNQFDYSDNASKVAAFIKSYRPDFADEVDNIMEELSILNKDLKSQENKEGQYDNQDVDEGFLSPR